MSRKILTAVLLLLFAAGLRVFALEVGATYRLDNQSFAPDRAAADETFAGTTLYWGGAAYLVQPLSANLSLEGGLSSDTVLRYTAYTRITFSQQSLTVSVGPILGLLNSTEVPVKPGLSASLRLMVPGIGYAEVLADTSLGLDLSTAGDYLQEQISASLGFYIPNAICSLGYQLKRYTARTAAGEVSDSLSDYSFRTQIFQKNVPLQIQLAFSYQTLARDFDETPLAALHTLSSIVIGTRVDWTLAKYLTLLLDLQSSVYTFGQDDLLGLSNPGPGGYLFRLYTGFRFDFTNLPKSRRV